jgi:hypothetical protein
MQSSKFHPRVSLSLIHYVWVGLGKYVLIFQHPYPQVILTAMLQGPYVFRYVFQV